MTRTYPDFPGKAGEYLQWIDRELLPALRAEWPISDQPADVGILGFSLGGLLASYAPYVSPSFGYAMSLSGSNWYEGLIPFFREHDPLTDCRFFLSYGRAEGAGKFSMQKDAAECAEAAAAALRSRLGDDHVTVTSDSGRHTTKPGWPGTQRRWPGSSSMGNSRNSNLTCPGWDGTPKSAGTVSSPIHIQMG